MIGHFEGVDSERGPRGRESDHKRYLIQVLGFNPDIPGARFGYGAPSEARARRTRFYSSLGPTPGSPSRLSHAA
jgi:hypothetical protein